MKVTIQSIHFDADKRLLEFIQTRCDKLDQYFDGIIDAQVFLRLEKNDEQGNKVVEIKVNVPNQTLLSKEQSRSFEEATDECISQLKRQITKYKERLKSV